MKILYVLDFFYPRVGGVPTVFLNLTKKISELGHDVTVITSHADSTKSRENLGKIKIYRFGKGREQFLFGATLNMLLLREKFDVIHTSTYSAMIPSYIFSLFRHTPKILTVHELWSFKEWLEFMSGEGLFYFLEERALFSLPFDYYICPSEHTREDIMKIGIDKKRIQVIPHGIDGKIFKSNMKKFRKHIRDKLGLSGDDIVGFFNGKPTVFKGINYLLDAIKKTSSRVNVKFVFLLSKDYKTEYEKFINKIENLGEVRKNIIVVEPSTDHTYVSKILASSDFLIMPSLTEGFGFAAAEAAAVGVPSIVTKGTSLVEVVDESNAVFVNPRDSDGLSDAMVKIAKSSALRRRLSKPKEFESWETVAKKYEKVYEGVISKYKEV